MATHHSKFAKLVLQKQVTLRFHRLNIQGGLWIGLVLEKNFLIRITIFQILHDAFCC